MDDITIEIVAELRDEASQPLKGLTALSERFTASLDAMRARLAATSAQAGALATALDGLGKLEAPSPRQSAGSDAGEGGARTVALDVSPAQVALSSLAQALSQGASGMGAALGGLGCALNSGASASGAALGALSGAAGASAQYMSSMGGAAQSTARQMQSASGSIERAGSAAQSAAGQMQSASGSMGRAGSAASQAASRLSSLGAAVSSLSSRFAGFRLPKYSAHASGGILSTPHLGMVAERGPEAIIPLSASRRARGLELLRQAGRRLGVREYAEGGVPSVQSALPALGGVNVGGVSVNISVSGGAESARALEQGGARIADQVAQAIAEGLERAMRNMP